MRQALSVNSEQIDFQALRRKAGMISFLVGLLMLVMKTGGYHVTGSAAILSDAMESIVHVIATGMALYSIILIGRPADSTHPYGYGKVEYFSAGVEGALIIAAAIAICYEAGRDLVLGVSLRDLDVGVWVVSIAGVINLALGTWLVRVGKRTNSLILVADGKHVLTDSYTSIGVLIGLILVKLTDVLLLDPLFAIAVALNILWTGFHLIRQSVHGLMNAADPDTLERVVARVNQIRTPEMIDLHRLRAWRSGETRFIDFHLTLPNYLHLDEVHQIQHDVHDALREEFNGDVDLMIHFDPCDSVVCTYCNKTDCRVREHSLEITTEFTVAEAQGEPMHRILGGDHATHS